MTWRLICGLRFPRWRVLATLVRFGVLLAATRGAMSQAAYISDPAAITDRPDPATASNGSAEVEKAVACYRRGEIRYCVDFLRLARKGNPDTLPAQVILAQLYLRDNQVAAAREALEQAAIDDPELPQVY